MDVSVIIVNWNTRGLLRECIKSVYQNGGDVACEVVVVDNASSDGSTEMVRSEFPQVKLIAEKINRGYAGAVNDGIASSRGRYILILNSDTLICDSAIEKTVRYADAHAEAAVIGCQVVLGNNGNIQMTCRRFPSLLNLLLDTLGLNRIFPENTFFGREYMLWWRRDSEREVDVISGMFMLVRRQAVDEVGLMDEKFFFLFEETDWCCRFSKAGWKMLFWPGARIIHVHGGGQSRKKAGVKIAMHYQKSMLIFYKKHYGYAEYLIARALLSISSVIRFLTWEILRLYRMLVGRNTQYEDEKIRVYWWSFWFCIVGLEPEKEASSGIILRNANVIKNEIETFCAMVYGAVLFLLCKKPAKIALAYHSVKKQHVEQFENQIKYLAKYCHVVRPSDIIESSADGKKPVVTIIFDDAYFGFFNNAIPILRRYGLTAAVAIPVGAMGKSPNWSKDDYYSGETEVVLDAKTAVELDRQGYEILSHTFSHCDLAKISGADLDSELCTSKRALEEILGHEVKGITYPYGTCNKTVIEAADKAGYRVGFSLELQTVGQSLNRMCIGRFGVSPDEQMLRFKLKVRGAFRIVYFLRKLKRILIGHPQIPVK